jgi:hypothetical protein
VDTASRSAATAARQQTRAPTWPHTSPALGWWRTASVRSGVVRGHDIHGGGVRRSGHVNPGALQDLGCQIRRATEVEIDTHPRISNVNWSAQLVEHPSQRRRRGMIKFRRAACVMAGPRTGTAHRPPSPPRWPAAAKLDTEADWREHLCPHGYRPCAELGSHLHCRAIEKSRRKFGSTWTYALMTALRAKAFS